MNIPKRGNANNACLFVFVFVFACVFLQITLS